MSFNGQIPEGRIIAAFSGGEDSLYLLLLLSMKAPGRVAAAYVNHGIRTDDELGREIALNKANAERLGTPLHIITLERDAVSSLAESKGIGTEAAARELRYDALESLRKQLGYDWIATAHHREDQAETVIMRLMSGAPLWALSGIQRQDGFIFRPLLDVPKAVISAELRNAGLEHSEDSTNSDTAYLRNRIRKNILPYISDEAKERLSSIALKCQALRVYEDIPAKEGFYISIDRKAFESASMMSKERVLFDAFDKMGFNGRVSRRTIRDIADMHGGHMDIGPVSVYFTKDEIRMYPALPDFAALCGDPFPINGLRLVSDLQDDKTLMIDPGIIAPPLIVRKSREGDWIETKYPYVCHAELNAILNSSLPSLKGATLYVALFPCNECAKAIIQVGIKKIIYLSNKYKDTDATKASVKMLEAAGVELQELKPQKGEIVLKF